LPQRYQKWYSFDCRVLWGTAPGVVY